MVLHFDSEIGMSGGYGGAGAVEWISHILFLLGSVDQTQYRGFDGGEGMGYLRW